MAKITQTPDFCKVETANGKSFRGKRVILSVPTTLHRTITFDPPLSPPKQILAEKTILGYHAKTILVFERPWWREAGLSGAMESLSGPISFTRDTCSELDGHYSITCFTVGESGRQWSVLSAPKREEQVLKHFNDVFGSCTKIDKQGIPQPINILEKEWTKDPWVLGGPVPVMPPEVLDSEAGKALGKPFGNIHFVGAETADVWRGYMEGAVRSGIRGANEAIASLVGAEQKVRSLL